MKKSTFLTFKTICFIFLTFHSKAQIEFDGKTIEGEWRIIDLKTDVEKMIVQVYKEKDEYAVKIMDLPNTDDAKNQICKNCTDDRKNKKLVGMHLIKHLKLENDKLHHGEYLEIEKGKLHHCSMWLENQDRIKLRVMYPILFKDEVWLRRS